MWRIESIYVSVDPAWLGIIRLFYGSNVAMLSVRLTYMSPVWQWLSEQNIDNVVSRLVESNVIISIACV
jgi:hypothetical protein